MIRILRIRRSFQAANNYSWSKFINYLQQESRHICSLCVYFKLLKFRYMELHIQGRAEPTAAQKAALFTKFLVRFFSLHQVLCCYGYTFICSSISQANATWIALIQIWDAALIAYKHVPQMQQKEFIVTSRLY